jgi:hypothetical protein
MPTLDKMARLPVLYAVARLRRHENCPAEHGISPHFDRTPRTREGAFVVPPRKLILDGTVDFHGEQYTAVEARIPVALPGDRAVSDLRRPNGTAGTAGDR